MRQAAHRKTLKRTVHFMLSCVNFDPLDKSHSIFFGIIGNPYLFKQGVFRIPGSNYKIHVVATAWVILSYHIKHIISNTENMFP